MSLFADYCMWISLVRMIGLAFFYFATTTRCGVPSTIIMYTPEAGSCTMVLSSACRRLESRRPIISYISTCRLAMPPSCSLHPGRGVVLMLWFVASMPWVGAKLAI